LFVRQPDDKHNSAWSVKVSWTAKNYFAAPRRSDNRADEKQKGRLAPAFFLKVSGPLAQ
jgi:hypothetical protein